MESNFSVTVGKIIKNFNLKTIFLPENAEEIEIVSTETNRPGLEFSGFYDFFDEQRIQILGHSEMSFLRNLSEEKRKHNLEIFFSKKPILTVIARNIEIFPEMLEYAEKYGCPLLHAAATTSHFMAELILFLNVELAPRITRHGVLVEVYGEGVLLLGESGVGKSETAMELVKRGHRLIADDAVEIRKVSSQTLVGSSPENIRHFMELRGIGIINVSRIFGIGSVKVTQQIDLIICLEQWDNKKVYDRMGIENEYTEILGNEVLSMTIPVKPGRNLAIIIEVAAMNNRQKSMGFNAAHELLSKLGFDDVPEQESKYDDWD